MTRFKKCDFCGRAAYGRVTISDRVGDKLGVPKHKHKLWSCKICMKAAYESEDGKIELGGEDLKITREHTSNLRRHGVID